MRKTAIERLKEHILRQNFTLSNHDIRKKNDEQKSSKEVTFRDRFTRFDEDYICVLLTRKELDFFSCN